MDPSYLLTSLKALMITLLKNSFKTSKHEGTHNRADGILILYCLYLFICKAEMPKKKKYSSQISLRGTQNSSMYFHILLYYMILQYDIMYYCTRYNNILELQEIRI